MICVKENRLVDAECTKAIFYYFKVIEFWTKIYSWNLLRNLNLPKWANKLKYKIDFGICLGICIAHGCTLIAIAYE